MTGRGLWTSIRLGMDADEANRRIRELEGRFGDAGRGINDAFGGRVGGALDAISTRLSGISRLAGGFGPVGIAIAGVGAAATAATAALAGLTKSAFDFAQDTATATNEVVRLADNLGVPVERFSALAQVAGEFGGTAEDVADVLKDMSVRAIENEGEFKELGISVRGANGELLQGERLFRSVATQIAGMSTELDKAAALDILASDAGVRLAEVMRLGGVEIEKRTQAIIESGRAIDRQEADVNRRFIDSINRVTTAFEGLRREVGTELGRVVTPYLRVVDSLIGKHGDLADTLGRDLATALERTLDLFLESMVAVTGYGSVFARTLADIQAAVDPFGIVGVDETTRKVADRLEQAAIDTQALVLRLRQERLRFARELETGSSPTGGSGVGSGSGLGPKDDKAKADAEAAAKLAEATARRIEAMEQQYELRRQRLRAGDDLVQLHELDRQAAIRQAREDFATPPEADMDTRIAAEEALAAAKLDINREFQAELTEVEEREAARRRNLEIEAWREQYGVLGTLAEQALGGVGQLISDTLTKAFGGQALDAGELFGGIITQLGTTLVQLGTAGLLAATLGSVIPALAPITGGPAGLGASAAAVAGGVAMIALGQSMGGSGGVAGAPAVSTGAGGPSPRGVRDAASLDVPRFSSREDSGSAQPAILQVVFNRPVDTRRARREFEQLMGAG